MIRCFVIKNLCVKMGWIKTGIRLCGVQSDPRLCCKHPGEFVIFSCFYLLLLIETCT